jgi:hypothetical protein
MSDTGGEKNPNGSHLMICLLVDNENVLVVPIVTERAFSDTTCKLNKEDHEFIKHTSCASYDHTKKISKSALEKKFQSKEYTQLEKVSMAKIIELWEGLLKSDETPIWVLDYAKQQSLPMMIVKLKEKLGD